MMFLHLTLALAQDAVLQPDLSGWDLRCLGACGVIRTETELVWESSGGTVFLEYHGLVMAQRKGGRGTVSVLQGDGQMKAILSDGEVLERPSGPQIHLVVDPALDPERRAELELLLEIQPATEEQAPVSTNLVRHRSGHRTLAEQLAAKIGAPTELLPTDANVHVEVLLAAPPPATTEAPAVAVEEPRTGLCGCSANPDSSRLGLLLALMLGACSLVRRR